MSYASVGRSLPVIYSSWEKWCLVQHRCHRRLLRWKFTRYGLYSAFSWNKVHLSYTLLISVWLDFQICVVILKYFLFVHSFVTRHV